MKKLSLFEQECVHTAITKLLSKSYFDICLLDSIGKTIGVNPEHHPNYKSLRLLHCIHYVDMTPTVRNSITVKVAECLSVRSDAADLITKVLFAEGTQHGNIEDAFVIEQPKKKTGILKLLRLEK